MIRVMRQCWKLYRSDSETETYLAYLLAILVVGAFLYQNRYRDTGRTFPSL